MNVFLRLSFVSVRKWIFRPLLALQYLNSAEINLNWSRTNFRKKVNQLSSKYDILFSKSHNILERYYFCTRKHIEVGIDFSLAIPILELRGQVQLWAASSTAREDHLRMSLQD